MSSVVEIAYALPNKEEADVTIVIDKDGKHTTDGNLFSSELWYPGKKERGTIRIVNNLNKKIRIYDLGLLVELKKTSQDYNKDEVYKSFLENMKLTIKKGRFLVFTDIITDNKSISDLLYKHNDKNYKGFKFKDSDIFNLSINNSIDLEYILTMDERSGNELQNLTADLTFVINVDEKHDNGNHYGWDNNQHRDEQEDDGGDDKDNIN